MVNIFPFSDVDDQQFHYSFNVNSNSDYDNYMQYKQMQFCPEIVYEMRSEYLLHDHDDG